MDSPQTPSDEMIEAVAKAIYEKDRSSPKWGSSLQSHESRMRWRLIAKEGLVAAGAVSEARTTQLETENAALKASIAADRASEAELRHDAMNVLTVYDDNTAPENRGPWRDRLMEWADKPVRMSVGGVNDRLMAKDADSDSALGGRVIPNG